MSSIWREKLRAPAKSRFTHPYDSKVCMLFFIPRRVPFERGTPISHTACLRRQVLFCDVTVFHRVGFLILNEDQLWFRMLFPLVAATGFRWWSEYTELECFR